MDQQQIKVFIDAMAASDLAEMEFGQDGWCLRLVRRPIGAAQAPASAAAPVADPVPVTVTPTTNTLDGVAAAMSLCAPLYGVVHLTPGPGEPAFVSVGQSVMAGQVLCVIEAMKVFNQIRAEHDATVAEVLVTSGQEVEAGQPLLCFT